MLSSSEIGSHEHLHQPLRMPGKHFRGPALAFSGHASPGQSKTSFPNRSRIKGPREFRDRVLRVPRRAELNL